MNRAALTRVASYAIVLFLLAGNAAAAIQHKISSDVLAPLGASTKAHGRVTIEGVPLIDDRAETLVLEEFDVLAPGAKIRFHREDGQVVDLTPAPLRQYQGHVAGEPESLVYVSVTSQKVEGFVFIRNRKFTLSSRPGRPGVRRAAFEGDVFVQEVPAEEEFAAGVANFECAVEGDMLRPTADMVPRSLATDSGPKPLLPQANAAPTGTQSTVLNLVLQGDSQLYTNFGNNAASVETFIRNLAGAASTIYQRDLATILRISHLDVFSTTDPWNIVLGQSGTWDGQNVTYGTLHALLQYGDYWHNTPPTDARKSAAMLISGMYTQSGGGYSFGGIAWTNILCTAEALNTSPSYPFPYVGHYRGAYGFCGGNGVFASDRTVPNPDGNPSYTAPSSGYWPLLQFAHELGHIVQSPHTHCVDTDSVTAGLQPVDNCFNGEGGCFSGTEALPAVGGTIMSYCHLNYGGTGTRFTFGQAGELSSTIRTNMRSRLATKTPGLSAITAPTSVNTGVSSNASVTLVAGMAYDWTITNGVINSGQGTNAITFTANADPVTIRATATNSLGCAISDFTTITATPGCTTAPSITGQPVGSTITAGQNASLSVTANSPVTMTYQWYRGASGNMADPVASATGATLNIAPNSTTSYWVRVTNSCGSTNSNAATVTVNSPCTNAAISGQPASSSLFAGQSVTLKVTATGTAPLTYQWYRGASGVTTNPVSGATASTLKVTLSQTTSFWVRVTNACFAVNSSTATVTVNPIPDAPPAAQKSRDFNGDSRGDVFWRYYVTGSNNIWMMNGGTRTPTTTTSIADLAWRIAAIGDFNLDGRADIFWRNAELGTNTIWMMNGGAVLSTHVQATVDLSYVLSGSGDFNGDGRADLFWRNTSTGANSIWLMNGATASPVSTNGVSDKNWEPLAFGDFNGDNRDDIFWRHRVSGATSAWMMNGATATTGSVATVADLNWYPRGSADFNGDGRDDLLWRNGSTGANVIWFMNGTSRTVGNLPTAAAAWRPVAFGNFDGNTTGDVMWRNTSTGEIRAWLMNGATISSNLVVTSLADAAWVPEPAR